MANAHGFEPDAKVRTNNYRIGCIGAGMIMAECHLGGLQGGWLSGRGDCLAHKGECASVPTAGASLRFTIRRSN